MTKWQWIFRQLTGRLWLRASVFCLIGIGSALLGFWLRPYLPDEITHKIGAPAVGDILNIIASSMLAVTTFSLSIMVAAYASATSNVTPRSTKLLLADQTSQNSLSTFIGSFLFSLVGIVALKMGVYGDSGRLVLFIVTILVILFIVLTLLRWIEYLSRLGRVGQTIDMVERAAMNAVDSFNRHPYLGGKPADGYIPDSNHDAITDARIGYIQYVDMETLSRLSENLEAPIYLTVRPGAFNDSLKPLAHVGTALSQEQADSLRDCFTIGGDRSFDQDPRYGLIVLSEIASRALSPAVNDPGTAIDILGTQVRIMARIARPEKKAEDPAYPSLFVPAIKPSDFFDDAYGAIARNSASMVEVGIRLQKSLRSLAGLGSGDFQKEAARMSHYAVALSNNAPLLDEDKKKIQDLSL